MVSAANKFNILLTVFAMAVAEESPLQRVKSSLISWLFIAGSVTLANPTDLVRFRMQVMPELIQQGYLKQRYKGLWDCLLRVKKEEGLRAFWKGNLSNMLRILPSETLIFWVKELFQKTFHYHHNFTPRQHFYINSTLGIASSSIVSFALYPLQYVRQVLSNRVDNSNITIFQQLAKTIKKSGLRGIYKGAHIFLIGLLFFRGTYFGIYDSLKVQTNDNLVRWFYSYLSIFSAIIVVYPVDTIRRRIVCSKGRYNGMIDCFRSIGKSQGIKAIFLGWKMVWVQSFTGSTLFYCYDKLFTDYKEAIS